MAADIILTAGTRNTLLALGRTSNLLTITANRLATGLRVASAVDDPAAFFDARSLQNRASNLQPIKDDIGLAVSSVTLALDTITQVDALIDKMKALALSANDTDNTLGASIAAQYDVLRSNIDNLVTDATFQDKNFVKASPDSLTVQFNVANTSSLTITGITSDVSALSISSAVSSFDNFKDNSDVTDATDELDAAILTLRATSARLGGYEGILSTRLDFIDSLINNLNEGAGKLVDADITAESANALALQTRTDLALAALGVTFENDTILRLLQSR